MKRTYSCPMLKKQIITVFFLVIAFSGFAQTVKLKWEPSFQQAVSDAKQTGKPILILFSGSDWCKSCIQLKKYTLGTETFALYSDKFILYNADFPYRIKLSKELVKANEEIAAKFNVDGKFPKVVFLSPDLQNLGSIGFVDCSPAEYIQKIEDLLND